MHAPPPITSDAVWKVASPAREDAAPAGLRRRWFAEAAQDVRLTRFVLLRGLGFIYALAFWILLWQGLPLLGSRGLLPIDRFLQRVASAVGGAEAVWNVPTLLWLSASDEFFVLLAAVGCALALALTLGFANAPLLLSLWAIYGSFVHAGQIFYGYGWEILLLEAGFLAIFLAPALDLRPRARAVPPLPVIWLYRWLVFRLMFGAGLIKLRGDPCWTDLSCLAYHYETQPNPHPLSWLLHQAPLWFHQGGVLFNHLVELIAPFGAFGPRRVRHVCGGLMALFQITLILSGNLSFLNWLTLVLVLSCFDDELLARVLPRRLCRALLDAEPAPLSKSRQRVTLALCVVVGLLSLNPIANMLSSRQRMNTGFEPLRLVNSYGAFGSVGKVRSEIVFEGARLTPGAAPADLSWRAYEFPCKPGDPTRAPCWVTPYHYRLDWQMWFAAMSRAEREPWLIHLAYQLLQGNEAVLSLLEHNPFPESPPDLLRATLYRYEFTSFGEPGWWKRTKLGPYLPPLSKQSPELSAYLRRVGLWSEPP